MKSSGFRPARVVLIPVVFTLVLMAMVLGSRAASYHASAQEQIQLSLPFTAKYFVWAQGTIHGIVSDAQSGTPLEDVNVCVTPAICVATDVTGAYSFDMYPGYWFMSAELPGYYSVEKKAFSTANENTQVNLAMSPVISGEEGLLRIVLSWSVVPTYTNPSPPPPFWENDLDAHMWVQSTITQTARPCHIQPFGDNDTECPDGNMYDCTIYPYACLETQVRRGSGPETIAVGSLLAAPTHYYYGVYNYNQYQPGVPELSKTGAHVDVYNEDGLLFSFDPPEDGLGNFWYILKIDSITGVVTPVNCIAVFGALDFDVFPEETPPCE